MEAPSRSWTLTDEFPSGTPAQAPLPFTATTGMGISGIDFTLSSNLALEAPCTGCAAPSVQAVVTLNLTSNSDLNDLLAGLLDNNTVGASGELGVNGSFEDVTYQLPSLGFNPVVMSALANAVAESDGLNGTPVSEAAPPPPPPPPCSGLICLWNTVSGIVVGIAGAIYGAVWTAVEAATQFLKQLGAGLSHLAEVAESAAVGVLAAVGAALEAALQALLAYLKSLLTKLLSDIVNTEESAISEMSDGVLGAMGLADNDLLGYFTGEVPQAALAGAVNAVFAPFMAIGFAVATIVAIGLTIALNLIPGAESLIVTLILAAIGGLIAGVVLASGLGKILSQAITTGMVPSITSFPPIAEGIYDKTEPTSSSSDIISKAPYAAPATDLSAQTQSNSDYAGAIDIALLIGSWALVTIGTLSLALEGGDSLEIGLALTGLMLVMVASFLEIVYNAITQEAPSQCDSSTTAAQISDLQQAQDYAYGFQGIAELSYPFDVLALIAGEATGELLDTVLSLIATGLDLWDIQLWGQEAAKYSAILAECP